MVRDKQLCTSWEKKMQAKQEKLLVKQYSLQLKEEKAKQKEVGWCFYPAVYAALCVCDIPLIFVCPGFIGQEEKERRKPEA